MALDNILWTPSSITILHLKQQVVPVSDIYNVKMGQGGILNIGILLFGIPPCPWDEAQEFRP